MVLVVERQSNQTYIFTSNGEIIVNTYFKELGKIISQEVDKSQGISDWEREWMEKAIFQGQLSEEEAHEEYLREQAEYDEIYCSCGALRIDCNEGYSEQPDYNEDIHLLCNPDYCDNCQSQIDIDGGCECNPYTD